MTSRDPANAAEGSMKPAGGDRGNWQGHRALRIGNAQGFWGDRSEAAHEMLAREPRLDFLTLDYLAEVSMSILAQKQVRDRDAGYAADFLDVVRTLLPYWKNGGRCRIITNAGGLNPHGCAKAVADLLAGGDCRSMRIAAVTGDDVLSEVHRAATDSQRSDLLRNLDTNAPISTIVGRLVTANAYLGAAPIVDALKNDAEIVITGRVADPSLTVAACAYHFDWPPHDWDRLAGATVAGHLIECGTQVTGGIFTDWLQVPDPAHMGFPIAEVLEDGSCILTKPQGTGGLVNEWTVKEQLLYEIGKPDRYLSPDVEVSFLTLNLADLGADRVRITGARGRPPPQTYKVSATCRDGFRAAGYLTIFGRDAVTKARRCGETILQRVADAGWQLRDSVIECLGTGACFPGVAPNSQGTEFLETVLRVAVEDDSRDAVERFAKEIAPLITSGPQGTTGYAEGRPRARPVFRYWPCLIERNAVQFQAEYIDSPGPAASGSSVTAMRAKERSAHVTAVSTSPGGAPSDHSRQSAEVRTLYDLAIARSGDKGTSANIGVISRVPDTYHMLVNWLTADRVREYFLPMGVIKVNRYLLPNLHAMNFVLTKVLSSNLRTDAQGKTLGQSLLELPLDEQVLKGILDGSHR